MKDVSIYIKYEQYKEIYSDSNQITVKVNFDEVVFPESLLDLFIYNQTYYHTFKKALFDKFNINILVLQSDDVIIKKVYSPISILEGINKLNKEIPKKFTSNIPSLLNKIDFKKFISKNKNNIFTFKIDDNLEEIKYGDLTRIILDKANYQAFLTGPELECMKHVFLLKEFMKQERIFLAYLLPEQSLNFYKNLIQKYDTEAFNKNVITAFKYSNKYKLNLAFETYLFGKNISDLLTKTIYLYLDLIKVLKYDFEFIDDDKVKKHRDFTRIEYIDKNNNRVTNYEFSLIFAKCLEKLQLNFEYNDNYIIVRIDKFILKFNSISTINNIEKKSIFNILKGILLINNNENTKKEFARTICQITTKIKNEQLNEEIFNMPLDKLNKIYKLNSSKRIISFKDKCEVLYKLIFSVSKSYNAIGYIFELKKILFNDNELNSNIRFNVIEELGNPVVIITINNTNINLYNSNKYIYYNPPKAIEELNLNEIRMLFFNGRFKYIKNHENIIGIEKSNI